MLSCEAVTQMEIMVWFLCLSPGFVWVRARACIARDPVLNRLFATVILLISHGRSIPFRFTQTQISSGTDWELWWDNLRNTGSQWSLPIEYQLSGAKYIPFRKQAVGLVISSALSKMNYLKKRELVTGHSPCPVLWAGWLTIHQTQPNRKF